MPDQLATADGRYVLHDLVGSGGMADVYRATDRVLDREVAVKLLRHQLGDAGATRRFEREARTLASLAHPNLVRVLDVSEPAAEQPYLVMDLVDGPTLGQRLRASGPLDHPTIRALGRQLAGALACVHAHGVIHRDVKPGNILLRTDGTPLLTDFGIAHLAEQTSAQTRTGEVVGSPAYLAPEQVNGTPPTSAVDVYALGLVLLECATGVRAYSGPPVEAALARLTVAPAVPTSLSHDLRDLVLAMTALDPADRPTAAEVEHALGGSVPFPAVPLVPAHAADEPTRALALAPPVPVRRPRGRYAAAAGALVAAVTLGLVATFALTPDPSDTAPSDTAEVEPAPTAVPSSSAPTPADRTTLTPVADRVPVTAPATKSTKAKAAKAKGKPAKAGKPGKPGKKAGKPKRPGKKP